MFAFIALHSETKTQTEVQTTAKAVAVAVAAVETPVGGIAGASQQQALNTGTDFIKAVASLGEAMSKLRSSATAILIAFALLVAALSAATVDDKVPDAKNKAAT